MPTLSGTVDCYPWDEHAILAHNLSYRPRPVIESYAASPDLAELNAG